MACEARFAQEAFPSQAILLNSNSEKRSVRLHFEAEDTPQTEESLNALATKSHQRFRAADSRALANAAHGYRRALIKSGRF